MAQIIKHRRGNLEGLSSATTRAGELLVVTGSSGLGTIANGDSLVFVGIDGSTATPVNKILQGTTVPDLTGADYNTHIDGIPFYDTDDNKLYILNKGGNIEVKATPETGGTGIVSGSSQVDGTAISNNSITISGTSVSLGGSITDETLFGGVGVVSGSSQVLDILGSLNSYTASNDTTNSTQNSRLDHLSTETGSISTEQAAQDSRLSNIEAATGSYLTTVDISDDTNLAVSDTAQVDMILTGDTLSANLKGGVISGSAQVVSALSNQATDFGTGRVSGDDFGDSAGTSTFTGSFEGDGSGLTGLATDLTVGADNGSDDTISLQSGVLNIVGTSGVIETTVTNDQVAIDIVDNPTLTGNVSITGDLNVQGTTTTINSTTLDVGDNIINLNYGGSSVYAGLYANDVTAPSTISGSILWDGTNDRWVAGQSGSEVNILLANGDGVVSGSSQITFADLASLPGGIVSGSSQVVLEDADKTGFTGASSITTLGTISTGVWNGTVIDKAYLDDEVLNTSLNSYTASNDTTNTTQNSRLDQLSTETGSIATEQAAQDTRLDQFATETGSIATEQSVQDQRLSSIETFTSSLDDDFVSQTELAAATGALETADSAQDVRIDALSDATSSYLTTVDISDDTNLAVSDTSTIDMVLSGDTLSANVIGGIHSGSAQVVSALSNQATDFGTGRVSADNIGNVAGDTTFTGSFSGDGSNLTGVASTLDISGSTGNGSISLKTQDLSVVGTSNEIETSVSGQTITIGLPDNVSIGNNLTVGGNLVVEGTTTTVDSTQVTIGDRILELNYARNAGDAGLLVTDVDGTTASGSLIWDSSTDAWAGGALSSEKEFARLNASPTSNTVLKANASGLLVDSLITDDGTDVTISGTAELRINAATANSFVYFDSNKSLESVAASTAGDVIQWNGSSFVASNEIDGGSF